MGYGDTGDAEGETAVEGSRLEVEWVQVAGKLRKGQVAGKLVFNLLES